MFPRDSGCWRRCASSMAAALAIRQITATLAAIRSRDSRRRRASAILRRRLASSDLHGEAAGADRPSHTRAVARLDLPPVPSHDSISLYRATEHRRPLFNGYSGYFAPHYWAMQYMVKQHNPAVLTRLSSYGPIEVVVDHDWDPDAGLRRFLPEAPQTIARLPRRSLFRVPGGARPASPRRFRNCRGSRSRLPRFQRSSTLRSCGAMIDHDIMRRVALRPRTAARRQVHGRSRRPCAR